MKITGTWMEKRIVRCMDRFHKICSTEGKATEGYTWSGWRLTRKQTTSRPDDVWPDMWTHVSDAAKKRRQNKDGLSRNQNSTMLDN